MAIRAYSSPGVSVIETVNAPLSGPLGVPSVLCLLGTASGGQSASERLNLTGTTAVTLRHTGLDSSSVVVKHGVTNETVNAGAYVVAAGSDPDITIAGDEPFTLRRAAAPTAAPLVSNAGTGTLVGTYVYAYSFVNAQGETGLSPTSAEVTLATQGTNLTTVAVGPGSGSDQVTARNIYRSKVVGGVQGTFHKVATIGNNSATTLSNETTIDATAATNPTPAVGIDSGGQIVVSYEYTDQNYYEPTKFDDYDDVIDKYGAPFDTDGAIASQLTLAARFAFLNGAGELVALAVKSGDVDFAEALQKLTGEDTVDLIIPVSGNTTVHSSLAAHVTAMNNAGLYRFGIIGRDGSATVVAPATLRPSASGYANEALSLVSPSRFNLINPITVTEQPIGSQYAAAAIGGMLVSRDVQVAITRKTLAGFVSLGEKRTPTDLFLDSQAGLLVVEPKGSVLRVRHGVTTAPTNVNTREISVVRAKYALIKRMRDAMDSLIGSTVPEEAASVILQNSAAGTLEELRTEGVIRAYQGVKARQLATDPTTFEVRFGYTPVYPINNIVINFTINTQTGEFALA